MKKFVFYFVGLLVFCVPVFAEHDDDHHHHQAEYPTPIPLSVLLTQQPTMQPARVTFQVTDTPTPTAIPTLAFMAIDPYEHATQQAATVTAAAVTTDTATPEPPRQIDQPTAMIEMVEATAEPLSDDQIGYSKGWLQVMCLLTFLVVMGVSLWLVYRHREVSDV